ncbi:DUF2752 domain-containing protein [Altibacter sp.]|uniref:DUF2752 domain-containing protein n=1 Tax=Altibacter sp. TaxID=2024823 RepID=UPI000C95D273|nr:DUF2752 domain-containing protein [Altibacter sp.]MAP54232.1 hypothetical protein [Altibacter sp.]
MEVSSLHPIKLYKVALLIVLLAGLLWVYHTFDPSEHAFFLPCPFHHLTGFLCPGCGSQRAIHHLLHGHIAAAFSLNPLLVLSLPLLMYGIYNKVYNYLFSTERRISLFYNKIFLYIYIGCVLFFWIFRNISE